MKNLLDKQWVRYVVVLLIGISIGAIFYPSKTITKSKTKELQEKIERLEVKNKLSIAHYEGHLNQLKKEKKQVEEEAKKTTESLKEENFKLKQRVSEKRFKLVKPDGTIEERWFKESETDVVSSTVTRIRSEFDRKVKSIENKWSKIHEKRIETIKEKYEDKISEIRRSQQTEIFKEKTEINARNFSFAIGLTNEVDYYSSITYDIFGPMFLDLHLEADKQLENKEFGVGIGIRF